MAMTPSQARVVDAVLTNVALGYKDANAVGSVLFPNVPVVKRGGRIIEFDDVIFKKWNLRRAPGAASLRFSPAYSDKLYALDQDKLEALVPDEIRDEAADVIPGYSYSTAAVQRTLKIVSRQVEIQQGEIATNVANYDASHKLDVSGTPWTDTANGDPIGNVKTGRSAVRDSIGIYPNVGIMSPTAFEAACDHPDILNRMKLTSDKVADEALLARVFKLDRVVVGKMIYTDDAGTKHDVWGDGMVLAYVPQQVTTEEEPSFAYTYVLRGHPVVMQPYRENNRDSWVYPVKYERAPVLTGMTAGYLVYGTGG